MKLCTSDT